MFNTQYSIFKEGAARPYQRIPEDWTLSIEYCTFRVSSFNNDFLFQQQRFIFLGIKKGCCPVSIRDKIGFSVITELGLSCLLNKDKSGFAVFTKTFRLGESKHG
jgi:hypothetical protein